MSSSIRSDDKYITITAGWENPARSWKSISGELFYTSTEFPETIHESLVNWSPDSTRSAISATGNIHVFFSMNNWATLIQIEI